MPKRILTGLLVVFTLVGIWFSNQHWEVLPVEEWHKRLDRSVADAPRRWIEVGSLRTTDEEFLLFDPAYLTPSSEPDDTYAVLLRGPADTTALVLVELVGAGKDVRVGAMQLRFEQGTVSRGRPVGKVGVDSGFLMISTPQQYRRNWCVGGPKSLSTLYLEWGKGKAHLRNLEKQAVPMLRDAGFGLVETEHWREFRPPLSDEEIEQADDLLSVFGGDAFVNTLEHHSYGIILDQYRDSHVVALEEEGQVYGFAFGAGGGDGTYSCWQLLRQNRLAGFECRFIT